MSEPPSRSERPVRVRPTPALSPSGRAWYFTKREFRHYKLLELRERMIGPLLLLPLAPVVIPMLIREESQDRRSWRDYERWDDARKEEGFDPIPDDWESDVLGEGEWVRIDESKSRSNQGGAGRPGSGHGAHRPARTAAGPDSHA